MYVARIFTLQSMFFNRNETRTAYEGRINNNTDDE